MAKSAATPEIANSDVSVLAAAASLRDDSGLRASLGLVRQLGKYTLRRSIGRGGFGEVFLAIDDSTWNLVAVKTLSAHRRADAAARARFELEIRIGTELRHPNILPVIDHALGEVPHFATPLIDGPNLLHLLGKRPMPVPDAVALLRPVAEAVHLAHTHGYLHRDLKPANIVVEKQTGKPFVADFGLAKVLHSDAGVTESLAVLGTQPYMPPEQLDPHLGEVSPATDVYGLGATLYHMLTGRAPFPRTDSGNRDLATQITWDPPIPPSKLNSQVPTDLDRLCLLCLQKSPHDRYASAAELAADLRRFEEGRPIEARLPGPAKRIYRQCRRHPRVVGVIAASLALAVTGGLVARHFATVAGESAKRVVTEQQRADTAQSEATEAKVEATEAKAESVQSTRLKRLRAYAADLREIEHAWKGNEVDRIAGLLGRHVPADNSDDLRGLEWYFWNERLQSLCESFQGDPGCLSLAMSSDGALLATADRTHAALWDLRTKKRLRRVPIGEGKVSNKPGDESGPRQSVAFSLDGKLMAATTSVNRTDERTTFLRVWDTSTGDTKLSVADSQRFISGRAVIFSQDGKYVIAGGIHGCWRAWNLGTGELAFTCFDDPAYIREQYQSSPPVTSLRFVPRTKLLVATADHTAAWTWPGKSTPALGSPVEIRREEPDDIAVGIRLWAGKIELQLPTRPKEEDSSRPSPDRTAVRGRTPQQRSRTRSSDIVGDNPKWPLDRNQPADSIFVAGNVVVAGCHDHVVRIWEIPTGFLKEPGTPTEFRGCTGQITAVTAAMSRVAAVTDNGTIFVWSGNAKPPQIAGSDIQPTTSAEGGISRSGALVADWKPGVGPIVIKDVAGKSLVEIPFRLGFSPSIEFSPNDQYAAIWADNAEYDERTESFRMGKGKPFVVWDVKAGRRTALLHCPPGTNHVRPCFSADGRRLAVGQRGQGVVLLDPATGTKRNIPHPADAVFLRFNPSGRYLAIGGSSDFGVWDIQSSSFVLEADQGVRQAAFHPDGRRVFASSKNEHRRMLIGDLEAGSIAPMLGGFAQTGTLALSPSGDRLYAVAGGILQVYLPETGDDEPIFTVVTDKLSEDPETLVATLESLMNSWKSRSHQAENP